jgi:predicted RecA/RadA family phage recombinase
MNEFIQDGKVIDYTNNTSATIPAGTVITAGGIVGITKRPIPAGSAGAIDTEGVFNMVKNGGVAFSFGDDVYWNTTSAYAQGSASEGVVKIGTAIEAATSAGATVKVKIG